MKTKQALIMASLAFCLALNSQLSAARAATLTVTSTADSGAGSLRDAIGRAPSGDTIDATGVSGTILLTSGELLVTNNLTILGPGPNNLAVSGNAASRVFHVGLASLYSSPPSLVSISGLTVTDGNADVGGGIYNEGSDLTVSNCNVIANSAGEGGGIYYDGNANGNDSLTILNCAVNGNSAIDDGGGIASYYGTTAVVGNSTLSSNVVTGDSGIGGALYIYGGTATLSGCTLSDDSAYLGGGIYNDGPDFVVLTVINSTLSGNSAFYGGGIYNHGDGFVSLMVTNSTLSGNSASAYGGGIYNDGSVDFADLQVFIINSTLSGNTASIGGGVYNAIYGRYAEWYLIIFNSTFNGNLGGGIYNIDEYYFEEDEAVIIGSSIFNAGDSTPNIISYQPIYSYGYNLSSDNGSGLLTKTTDLINTNPKLGPLQDNGGPTYTCALLLGSPAIDQGTNFTGLATDQRGQRRTYDNPAIPNAVGGDGTDIGAFELIPPALAIVKNGPDSVQVSWPNTDGYNLQTNNNLNSSKWTNYDGTVTTVNGTNSVTTAPPVGNLFFRLATP